VHGRAENVPATFSDTTIAPVKQAERNIRRVQTADWTEKERIQAGSLQSYEHVQPRRKLCLAGMLCMNTTRVWRCDEWEAEVVDLVGACNALSKETEEVKSKYRVWEWRSKCSEDSRRMTVASFQIHGALEYERGESEYETRTGRRPLTVERTMCREGRQRERGLQIQMSQEYYSPLFSGGTWRLW
jgi:hypothetical protein